MHPLIELALELITDDGEEWGYYFADHDKRIIFWFDDHESRPLMNKVRGVECKSHISEFSPRRSFYSSFCNCVASRVCTRSAILVRTTSSMPVPSHDRSTMHSHFIPVLLYLTRFTYHDIIRRHVELFPNKRFLPENVIVKLKEIVMFAQAGE